MGQAVVERFGLIAEVPVAVAILQGSEWRCENGVNGDGVGDARKLWTELRRQTAYAPHSLALPWIFVQSRTHKEHADSLALPWIFVQSRTHKEQGACGLVAVAPREKN